MIATVIIILILIIAILMILVILPQNPKGGGLSSQMGGVAQIAGTHRTTDLLEKITWGMCIAIFVLAIGSNIIIRSTTKQSTFASPNVEAVSGKSVGDANAPATGTETPATTGTETPATGTEAPATTGTEKPVENPTK